MSQIMEIPIVKKIGRPKGSPNVIPPPPKPPKPVCVIGRPIVFGTPDDGLTTYQRRGKYVNTILSLKRKYNLMLPEPSSYVGQPNDVVIDILKQMAVVVLQVKYQRKIDSLERMKIVEKNIIQTRTQLAEETNTRVEF